MGKNQTEEPPWCMMVEDYYEGWPLLGPLVWDEFPERDLHPNWVAHLAVGHVSLARWPRRAIRAVFRQSLQNASKHDFGSL